LDCSKTEDELFGDIVFSLIQRQILHRIIFSLEEKKRKGGRKRKEEPGQESKNVTETKIEEKEEQGNFPNF